MAFELIEELICSNLSSTLWKLGLISRYEHVSMLRISERYALNYEWIKRDH